MIGEENEISEALIRQIQKAMDILGNSGENVLNNVLLRNQKNQMIIPVLINSIYRSKPVGPYAIP